MKKAILVVAILAASVSAQAMGNRDFNVNKFGSKDNQRKHNYTVKSDTSIPPVYPTPEPGTLLMVGGGLIGLAIWGRKKS